MSTKNEPKGFIHSDISDEQVYIEDIRTTSRVPEKPSYYGKGGLRIDGDGVDHSHYNPVSTAMIGRLMPFPFMIYERC